MASTENFEPKVPSVGEEIRRETGIASDREMKELKESVRRKKAPQKSADGENPHTRAPNQEGYF